MSKTKAQVRSFLDSQVGTSPVDKSDSSLNGQCVALIKRLMEFLGVSNPYGARGNAKNAGDAYIAQGIGTAGRGWLTICVNRSYGNGTGHIWVDLSNETNYEANGAKHLIVTKGTRSITEAQQFVNFDKWIGGGTMADKSNLATARQLAYAILGRDGHDGRPNAMNKECDGDLNKGHASANLTVQYLNGLFDSSEAVSYRSKIGKVYSDLTTANGKVTSLTGDLKTANDKVTTLQDQSATLERQVTSLENEALEYKNKIADLESQIGSDQKTLWQNITELVQLVVNKLKGDK